MKRYLQAIIRRIPFLTGVALLLAAIIIFSIIKNDSDAVLIALAAILTASLALIIYWFVKRKILSNTEKWGIILSIIVWSALFYSLIHGL